MKGKGILRKSFLNEMSISEIEKYYISEGCHCFAFALQELFPFLKIGGLDEVDSSWLNEGLYASIPHFFTYDPLDKGYIYKRKPNSIFDVKGKQLLDDIKYSFCDEKCIFREFSRKEIEHLIGDNKPLYECEVEEAKYFIKNQLKNRFKILYKDKREKSIILYSGRFFSRLFQIKTINKENLTNCEDTNKSVASGYPHILYHATVNRESVCDNGLKPSCELEIKALGQIVCENDKKISFTYNKQIGIAIANDLKTLIRMANEEIDFNNIAEELDKVDNEGKIVNGKEHWIGIKKKVDPSGIYRNVKMDGENILLLKLEPNKRYYFPISKRPSEIWKETLEDKISIYYISEEKKLLYELWCRYYLPKREKYGGRHNCWFAVSSDPATLKGLKISDVGLFQVTAYIPKKEISTRGHYYKETEGKWKDNDFDLPLDESNYKGGEDRNFEIKISKERFTDLEEISFKFKIPNNVIDLTYQIV